MNTRSDMRTDRQHPKLIDAESVTLVPDTGIQFLDYAFDASSARKLSFQFFDEYRSSSSKDGRHVIVHPLAAVTEDGGDDAGADDRSYASLLPGGPTGLGAEETYHVSGRQALKIFDRVWLPVPFYRIGTSPGSFDDGPTNWARVYIAAPGPQDPQDAAYRVVLAFDTEILERPADGCYAAPEKSDVVDLIQFAWVGDINKQLAFAGGDWQRPWIESVYREVRPQSSAPDPDDDDDTAQRLGEPWAAYAVFLQSLQTIIRFPIVSLIDVVSIAEEAASKRSGAGSSKGLDVALVLDIGNSRTCGILVEQGFDDNTGTLGQTPARLELRDLSRPEQLTSEPFESRVEFQPTTFGRREYGRRSGRITRKDAFWWPSPLRTGPEAAWLQSLSDGRDGISGMSSPKRYVWDKDPRVQPWVNNRARRPATERVPPIQSPISTLLRTDGKPAGKDGHGLGLETAYSRSSMYMLLVAEVICHALGQINSVSYRRQRANTDVPRRLRKILLTLPSATPIAEQRRMKKLARDAIAIVWKAYGWSDDAWLHPKPKLIFDIDEATCTQLVYLYNELEHRFREFPEGLFALLGRQRTGPAGEPALRIASIDIGGGTTDLMIIEHTLNAEIITPRQLFREGFRQAGDDVLKRVIECALLPPLIDAMATAGVAHPGQLVTRLFSGDTEDVTRPEQVNRSLFVNEVLIPAALGLLAQYEHSDARFPQEPPETSIGDLVHLDRISNAVLAYVDREVERLTGTPFSTLAVRVRMDARIMAGTVQSVLGHALEDICDVVRAYDCDLLLLTGRPCAMPAVRDIVRANAPVPPERFIPMYGYRIGNWYPFRSDDMRIWDAKTTASVGALLCHLCEGRFASFVFLASELMIASTANFIGKMDQKGQITERNLIFDRSQPQDEFDVVMGPGLDIGYRQLPIERWVTSQLYHVYYRTEEIARRTSVPVTVRLQFTNPDPDDQIEEEQDVRLRKRAYAEQQFAREELRIEDAVDRHGSPCGDAIAIRLQTFRTIDKLDAGYWLDTGVLSTTFMVGDDETA